MDVLDLLLANTPLTIPNDTVFVHDVQIQAHIGPDAWARNKSQPVIVSANLPFLVTEAGSSDDIAHTLDYRTVYKAIRAYDAGDSADALQHGGLLQLARTMAHKLKLDNGARLTLEAPKALLHSDGIVIRLQSDGSSEHTMVGLCIKRLLIPCIIGIGDHERLQKQPVVVDFAILATEIVNGESLPSKLADTFVRFEKSTFLTLEAFVTSFARYLTVDLGFSKVAVSAHKPSVFSMAKGPGVLVLRTKEFFETEKT